MWLPTVPTRAHPESSAAPSTARRSRATSLRSPRSCARVARAGVALWGGASVAAAAVVAAFAVVFLVGAAAVPAVDVAWVASVVLVALAVARRRLVVGGAGSSSG